MEFEKNKYYNIDCMKAFKDIEDDSVDLLLTDIPYNSINNSVKYEGGLRKFNKGKADELNMDLMELLKELDRITKGTVIIFCGLEQVSDIFGFFKHQCKGTTRVLVWEKTNPSPVNGQYVYLSGIELAVWHKNPGATFNAFCKNTVFRHSSGTRKIHATQKNVELFEELVLDNSAEGDLVLDAFMGSGTTAIACIRHNRDWIGFEIDEGFYKSGYKRIKAEEEKQKQRDKQLTFESYKKGLQNGEDK